jgi:NADH:ubiquinone oxidoreductase subunit 3 (subunit A)
MENSTKKIWPIKEFIILRIMIIQFLVMMTDSILGAGKPTSRGNYAYHCAFCNHHKPKLEVNLLLIKIIPTHGHVGHAAKKERN